MQSLMGLLALSEDQVFSFDEIILFVAVSLPGTGANSTEAVQAVLGVRFKKQPGRSLVYPPSSCRLRD
jgi:uncharacterized membrane protein